MKSQEAKTSQGPTLRVAAVDGVKREFVIANGNEVEARVPCSLESFLVERGLLPRSVVVEHNGEAVAPSEFAERRVEVGDRLEIVKIVAGG